MSLQQPVYVAGSSVVEGVRMFCMGIAFGRRSQIGKAHHRDVVKLLGAADKLSDVFINRVERVFLGGLL